MTKNIGVISDLGGLGIECLIPAIGELREEGADSIVLLGNIVQPGKDSPNKMRHVYSILAWAGEKLGLDSYFVPGSTELFQDFEPCNLLREKLSKRIHNVFMTPRIEFEEGHIVFLPGTDRPRGEASMLGYRLDENVDSGIYKSNRGLLRTINPSDLRRLVTEPGRTVMFSHVPARFSLEGCVDVQETYTAMTDMEEKDSAGNQRVIPNGTEMYGPGARRRFLAGAQFAVKRDNGGSALLGDLYKEIGIRKAVSARCPESAGAAHDWNGMKVEGGVYVDELFYNPGIAEPHRFNVGLLSMEGNGRTRVAYENLDIHAKIDNVTGALKKQEER